MLESLKKIKMLVQSSRAKWECNPNMKLLLLKDWENYDLFVASFHCRINKNYKIKMSTIKYEILRDFKKL